MFKRALNFFLRSDANLRFKKLLFKSAFSVMACDGEISEEEIVEMKAMMQQLHYFRGLDYDGEIQQAVEAMTSEGHQSIESFIYELQDTSLTYDQELQVAEVVLRMIEADDKIEDNELYLWHRVFDSLSISKEEVLNRFPKCAVIINDLTHAQEPSHYKNDIAKIDLSMFDMARVNFFI